MSNNNDNFEVINIEEKLEEFVDENIELIFCTLALAGLIYFRKKKNKNESDNNNNE